MKKKNLVRVEGVEGKAGKGCDQIMAVYDMYAEHPRDPMVPLALLGDPNVAKHLRRCKKCFAYGEEKAAEAQRKLRIAMP